MDKVLRRWGEERNVWFVNAILGLQPTPGLEIQKTMVWQPCWMTERFVLSSNMAAMPLSFWISRDWLQTKNWFSAVVVSLPN